MGAGGQENWGSSGKNDFASAAKVGGLPILA
jgi:hypothetical protein